MAHTPHQPITWGFVKELDPIPAPFAQLLSDYSSIPPNEQSRHVTEVRDEAWAICPYPCLARFRFAELDMARHPLYEEHILEPLRAPSQANPPCFLDIGTCLGQDIRKLIHDGARAEYVYGSDTSSAFIDLSYKLFRDESKIPRDHFLYPANLLSENDALSRLDGKATILHVGAVFHLFSEEEQELAAERCLKLLRPNGKVLILGNQVGHTTASSASSESGMRGFLHSQESWKRTWDNVSKKEPWKDAIKEINVWSFMLPPDAVGGLGKVSGEQVHVGISWKLWSVWVDFGHGK